MSHDVHAHEHDHKPSAFGKNTTGIGLFLIAAIILLLILFGWNKWKGATAEADHYRWETTEAGHDAHGGHDAHAAGHGEPAHEEAAPVALVKPEELGSFDSTSGNFIYSTGESITITLPDSAKTLLTVGAHSTEAKLYHFLSDAAEKVNETDKTQGWITCDRIYFESGKASLTAASKKQVANIAAILKAFPAATVKVGGYTDNTGSEPANKKVSGERAGAVAAAVKGSGIANEIASEGYGPEHPIADNATKEGQALNRRVDIRVTKK